MNPDPLLGMLTNNIFNHFCEPLRIDLTCPFRYFPVPASAPREDRIANDISEVLRPSTRIRDNGGFRVQRHAREACRRTRLFAEEFDRTTLLRAWCSGPPGLPTVPALFQIRNIPLAASFLKIGRFPESPTVSFTSASRGLLSRGRAM